MIDRKRLSAALEEELRLFREARPVSEALYREGRDHLLYGVPMNWMQMWPGGFPVTVREGWGAEIVDVDGHRYEDFCLGYSAAFNGHTPAAVISELSKQMEKGSVYTLPSMNSDKAARMLAQRFGLPVWGFALSATDANRFAIRICREITGRRKILTFNGCYHGTVDECFAALEEGSVRTRAGGIGPAIDAAELTGVVEFNDFEQLEQALRTEAYACLLMEPVMTNCGIIHPEPGFLDACARLSRETGTIWIVDEAHTITAGPSGYSGFVGLAPDMLILGKCIGGGYPVGCYGLKDSLAEKLYGSTRAEYADTSGIGGTMTGGPMAMAALIATIEHCLTEENYRESIGMALEFAAGIERVICKYELPFRTNVVGARAEYVFSPRLARNAAESFAMADHDLYNYFFVGSLNRGFLMSPYYNIMASFSADTNKEAVIRHEAVFEELVLGII